MSLLASVLNTIAEVVFSHSLQEGIRNILWHGSHFNLRHSLSLVMFKCTSQYTTCTNILVVRCFLFYFFFFASNRRSSRLWIKLITLFAISWRFDVDIWLYNWEFGNNGTKLMQELSWINSAIHQWLEMALSSTCVLIN